MDACCAMHASAHATSWLGLARMYVLWPPITYIRRHVYLTARSIDVCKDKVGRHELNECTCMDITSKDAK